MDTFLEWKIVVARRRFISGHRTVGGKEEEDHKIKEERSDGFAKKQIH